MKYPKVSTSEADRIVAQCLNCTLRCTVVVLVQDKCIPFEYCSLLPKSKLKRKRIMDSKSVHEVSKEEDETSTTSSTKPDHSDDNNKGKGNDNDSSNDKGCDGDGNGNGDNTKDSTSQITTTEATTVTEETPPTTDTNKTMTTSSLRKRKQQKQSQSNVSQEEEEEQVDVVDNDRRSTSDTDNNNSNPEDVLVAEGAEKPTATATTSKRAASTQATLQEEDATTTTATTAATTDAAAASTTKMSAAEVAKTRKRKSNSNSNSNNDKNNRTVSTTTATATSTATCSATNRPIQQRQQRASSSSSSLPTLPSSPANTNKNIIEFPLSSISQYLTCSLCDGLYKDPHTLIECLHTFCKSCLFYSISCGCHECPTCKVYLGNDPLKVSVLDHILQELIDRIVLPPEFIHDELQQEYEFYTIKRNIPLKKQYQQLQQDSENDNPTETNNTAAAATTTAADDDGDTVGAPPSSKRQKSSSATGGGGTSSSSKSQQKRSSSSSSSNNRRNNGNDEKKQGVSSTQDEILEFTLLPEIVSNRQRVVAGATSTANMPTSLPPLERPCLRVSGKMRMYQLKKYLLQKLNLTPNTNPRNTTTHALSTTTTNHTDKSNQNGSPQPPVTMSSSTATTTATTAAALPGSPPENTVARFAPTIATTTHLPYDTNDNNDPSTVSIFLRCACIVHGSFGFVYVGPTPYTHSLFLNAVLIYFVVCLLLLSNVHIIQIQLDILCNGVPLGNEISFSFVKRLLWHGESDLHLSYRIASDAF